MSAQRPSEANVQNRQANKQRAWHLQRSWRFDGSRAWDRSKVQPSRSILTGVLGAISGDVGVKVCQTRGVAGRTM